MYIQTEHFGEVALLNFTDASKEDLLYVLKMRNYPEIKKWMYSQADISEQRHFNFVEKLKTDKTKQYFLVKKNDSLVGVIYFTDIDYESSSLIFGLYADMFDKPLKAGSILVELALQFIQEKLKLNKVFLEVFTSNEKAKKMYKKYGFEIIEKQEKKGFEILSMAKSLEN